MAEKLEEEHVQKVYEEIVDSFDETRYKPWPQVKNFIESLPKDSLIGDIGCGNGRNMLIRNDVIFKGCDLCNGFVTLCQKKGLDVIKGNNLNIPFDTETFDATISGAVIHHFATEERRIKAIEELIRITKKGCQIYISVWANKYKIPEDRYVPWKKSNKSNVKVKDRFYHFFGHGELEELIKKTKYNVAIKKVWLESDNYHIILLKET